MQSGRGRGLNSEIFIGYSNLFCFALSNHNIYMKNLSITTSAVFFISVFILVSCSNSSVKTEKRGALFAENDAFSILDFGAVNDTSVVSTGAIQKAIDECSEKGGKVIIPEGKYVSGTLNIKSNVELFLDKGAELLGSLSLSDYSDTITGAVEAPAFDKCLLYAKNASNIKISGSGKINGRDTGKIFPLKQKGIILESVLCLCVL